MRAGLAWCLSVCLPARRRAAAPVDRHLAVAACAAQVEVCCFDKTGTLTSDDMLLEGVAGLPGCGGADGLLGADDLAALPREAARVMAACHSLVHVDGELVGDPLELAAFQATGACDGAPRR
jgi:magnesium-transporting ATPase (P-type)